MKIKTHEANLLAFIKIERNTLGVTPLASEPNPSSRTIYIAVSTLSDVYISMEIDKIRKRFRMTYASRITVATALDSTSSDIIAGKREVNGIR